MMSGMVDRRLERMWDRQLEEGLPDCRLRSGRETKRVQRAHMWWDQVFCASCGMLKGLVTSDWTPHIFYICDPCVAKLGPPAGAVEAADVPMVETR
jgi:hypothetical protein